MWKVRKFSLRYALLCVAMAATLLSQMPALHGLSGYSACYSALWVMLLITSFLERRRWQIDQTFVGIAVSLLVWIALMLLGMFTEDK